MRNFTMVPNEALEDPELTAGEKIVLIALYRYRPKNSDTVHPKISTIAKVTGMHEATISRATTKLMKKGWLTKGGNRGRSRPSLYKLHIPERLIERSTIYGKVDRKKGDPEVTSIKQIYSPTPATARRSPRSGVEPYADAGVGKEIIDIKESILTKEYDPVRDNTEHYSSSESEPDWANDFGSDDKKNDNNDDPFPTIQQTTESPPPRPLRGDTVVCNQPSYGWDKDDCFKFITKVFPSITTAQRETGYAAYLEWIKEGYRPDVIFVEATEHSKTNSGAEDFLEFFSSISVMDQHTPKRVEPVKTKVIDFSNSRKQS